MQFSNQTNSWGEDTHELAVVVLAKEPDELCLIEKDRSAAVES